MDCIAFRIADIAFWILCIVDIVALILIEACLSHFGFSRAGLPGFVCCGGDVSETVVVCK